MDLELYPIRIGESKYWLRPWSHVPGEYPEIHGPYDPRGDDGAAPMEGINSLNGELVSCSKPGMGDDRRYRNTEADVVLRASLRHKNIEEALDVLEVKRGGIFLKAKKNERLIVTMVTRGLQIADLFEVVLHNNGLTESSARLYFRQLLSGLAYLHACGIAHRDIKLENCMVYGEDRQHLKIGKFEYAQRGGPSRQVLNPSLLPCQDSCTHTCAHDIV